MQYSSNTWWKDNKRHMSHDPKKLAIIWDILKDTFLCINIKMPCMFKHVLLAKRTSLPTHSSLSKGTLAIKLSYKHGAIQRPVVYQICQELWSSTIPRIKHLETAWFSCELTYSLSPLSSNLNKVRNFKVEVANPRQRVLILNWSRVEEAP